MSETSRYAAQTAWNRENTTQIKIKLNNKTDADIIKKLNEEEHTATYIKRLIREDCAKEDKPGMQVTLYRNYGVLAHEKETVYSVDTYIDGAVHECCMYEISPELKPYRSAMEIVCVELDGQSYELKDIIDCQDGEPCVRWFDGQSQKWRYLGKELKG